MNTYSLRVFTIRLLAVALYLTVCTLGQADPLLQDNFNLSPIPATPSAAVWASRPTNTVVASPEAFAGSPHVIVQGASKLFRSVPLTDLPQVFTLSFSFVEPTGTGSPVKFGLVKAGQTDINTPGAFLRMELDRGNVTLGQPLNGISAVDAGDPGYPLGEAVRVHLIVNTGMMPVADYAPGQTLDPYSAHLWISDLATGSSTLALVMNLSAATGAPSSFALRTFSADSGALIRIDDLLIQSGVVPPGSALIKHPGLFSTQQSLEDVSTNVLGTGNHPQKLGWSNLLGDPRASLSYEPFAYSHVDFSPSGYTTSETRIRDDAHAAYAHAIQWAVTQNPAHAAKAIQILNLWSSTLQSFSSTGSPATQTELECAWLVPIFAAAAEIIRHYDNGAAGWARADVIAFTRFLDLLADEAAKSANRPNNWGASSALARLARAVFKSDPDATALALQNCRERLDAIFPADLAQSLEIGRDSYHIQYSLMALVQAAQIAESQGEDLYGLCLGAQQEPRLALALEYFGECFQGARPSPVTGIIYADAGIGMTAYEMALLHYASVGIDLPEFAAFVLNQIRPDARYLLFASWSTLTHGLELEVEPINLAPLCSLTASSTCSATVSANNGGAGNKAFVTDGISNTRLSRWISGSPTDGGFPAPHWVEFTLPSLRTVTGFRVWTGSTLAGYQIGAFQFQAWDRSGWVDIPGAGVTNNNADMAYGAFNDLPVTPTKTRRVRLMITTPCVRADTLNARVGEVQIFGW